MSCWTWYKRTAAAAALAATVNPKVDFLRRQARGPTAKFQIGDQAGDEHNPQPLWGARFVNRVSAAQKVVPHDPLRPTHHFEVLATRRVTADVDKFFVGNRMTLKATSRYRIQVFGIAHSAGDALRKPLQSMLIVFGMLVGRRATVVGMDRDPIASRTVTRLARNAFDDARQIAFSLRRIVAVDADIVSLDARLSKLAGDFGGLRISVQRLKSLRVGRLLPDVDFADMAFAARGGRHDLGRIAVPRLSQRAVVR